jgi:radical SAM superfamily enzyme YgiQ (UPF0313 family)
MRIAYIAMSGRRADLHLHASMPNLALLTLAGMTPAGHTVRYFELEAADEFATHVADFDLVAISTLRQGMSEALKLADRCRESGLPVVMGGLQASANPDEARAHGATVVVGEGESVWPEIIEDARRGALKPVYDGHCRDFDLANAPLPAYELVDHSRYGKVPVQTSRGCPWRCTFCPNATLMSGKFKQKPRAKVLAEIDRIRELWPRPFIVFVDDNAFVNRHYWRALLPQLKTRGIKWSAETDISVHEDEELLGMMRDAGCVEVAIGIESPVPLGLDGVELRHNFKHERQHQARRAIERIQAAGIRVKACFLAGLDGHGPWIFGAVRDFVREARPYDVQVQAPAAICGTPFYERLKRAGRLLEPCGESDITYRPQGMSVGQLQEGLQALIADLHNSARERRMHFGRPAGQAGERPSLWTHFWQASVLEGAMA